MLLMEKLDMDKIDVFFNRNRHVLVQSRERNYPFLGENIYGFGMNFLLKHTMIDFPSFTERVSESLGFALLVFLNNIFNSEEKKRHPYKLNEFHTHLLAFFFK